MNDPRYERMRTQLDRAQAFKRTNDGVAGSGGMVAVTQADLHWLLAFYAGWYSEQCAKVPIIKERADG